LHYDKLTGWEYLELVVGLFSMDMGVAHDRAKKILDFFDLNDFSDELIEGYSHGMKQKLIISGALIHNPKVLIVDEPLVGLDRLNNCFKIYAPKAQRFFFQHIS
jgi:ABC-2 type transport system ATP-binding protein